MRKHNKGVLFNQLQSPSFVAVCGFGDVIHNTATEHCSFASIALKLLLGKYV